MDSSHIFIGIVGFLILILVLTGTVFAFVMTILQITKALTRRRYENDDEPLDEEM